jgi:curli production assembly/transport component CsgG
MATMGTTPASVARMTTSKRELISLPPPKGPMKVAVYNFRDQTGQYKQQANVSSFSTAVTQGATALLVQALKDSNWFIPLEREGLQNLLTERKIIRASLEKTGQATEALPSLQTASLLIEGGIVGYDTNLVTGGLGAKYFGLGGDIEYRVDQVTVNLRAVDINTGQVLKSLSTTKTVLSRKVTAGIFRFIEFKRLLEAEVGLTTNEPVLLAVQGAIEKAVFSLVIEGLREGLWVLKDATDMRHPAILDYFAELIKVTGPLPGNRIKIKSL